MKARSSKRLRIAVAILGTESGGVRTFLLNQLAKAPAVDIDFQYLALQEGPICSELRAAGASVASIDCPVPDTLPGAPVRSLARWFFPGGGFFGGLRKLHSQLARRAPDCLYSHFLHTHILCGIVGRRLGIPRVGHVHGTINPIRLFGLTRISYSTVLAQSLNAIIVVSKTARESLAHVARNKARFVYNGIDVGLVERQASAISKKPGKVIALGRLVRGKKIELAIRAVASLIHSGVDCSLEVVGGPLDELNEYAQRLRKMVRDLKVEDRVTFTGPVNPPFERLAGAEVLANCSTVEGLPYVVMESLLCRAAVIVANRGAPSEIIQHEQTGLHFQADDSESLAAAILRLLRDGELRRRLTEAGLMYARSAFDISKHMDVMRGIFEEIIVCVEKPDSAPPR